MIYDWIAPAAAWRTYGLHEGDKVDLPADQPNEKPGLPTSRPACAKASSAPKGGKGGIQPGCRFYWLLMLPKKFLRIKGDRYSP